ncbi:MAG: phosphoenolpyruvate--protein phosphotransferase [Candidatus Limnocylindrales bacterium]
MRRFCGVPASPGIAMGPWQAMSDREQPRGRRIAPEEAEEQIARLERAAEAAAADLDALGGRLAKDGHPDEAAIFAAHAMMARDPALLALATEQVRLGHDAIVAIGAAGEDIAGQLRALDDEVLSARAADVVDVAARIADRLSGAASATVDLAVPSIIVAHDLPPSVAATLPRDRLLGIALESGSPTAHAAILARAFGIPAVVGVQGLLAALAAEPPRAALWLDGATGELVLDPDTATGRDLDQRRAAQLDADAAGVAEARLPTVTTDGVEVTLLANIGTPAESERALRYGAQGVGLFRTEFLFLERDAAPDEDEQTAAYAAVTQAFAPLPVTIRLLDVGGDKPIPYLPVPAEANPFLGVRALRLAPERPDLFVGQLRAAMRSAASTPGRPTPRVKVMAPMVADAADAALLCDLAARAARELDAEGVPHGEVELGVMLEIPSAVLVARSYLSTLAFASLGTNDLLQYTLAADRGNAALARYQDSLHPALLRLVAEAVAHARDTGTELSVCGEMAGDTLGALALVGLGVRTLSMSAGSLAAVRRTIRDHALADLQTAAVAALDAPSADEVRARFAARGATD